MSVILNPSVSAYAMTLLFNMPNSLTLPLKMYTNPTKLFSPNTGYKPKLDKLCTSMKTSLLCVSARA